MVKVKQRPMSSGWNSSYIKAKWTLGGNFTKTKSVFIGMVKAGPLEVQQTEEQASDNHAAAGSPPSSPASTVLHLYTPPTRISKKQKSQGRPFPPKPPSMWTAEEQERYEQEAEEDEKSDVSSSHEEVMPPSANVVDQIEDNTRHEPTTTAHGVHWYEDDEACKQGIGQPVPKRGWKFN